MVLPEYVCNEEGRTVHSESHDLLDSWTGFTEVSIHDGPSSREKVSMAILFCNLEAEMHTGKVFSVGGEGCNVTIQFSEAVCDARGLLHSRKLCVRARAPIFSGI